jgi:acyl carrier protein
MNSESFTTDDKIRAQDAIASEVEAILTSLLGLDAGTKIDRWRRFEAMGVDSLLAMDLIAALEAHHGTLLETILRDNPTVHQLSEALYHLPGRAPE